MVSESQLRVRILSPMYSDFWDFFGIDFSFSFFFLALNYYFLSFWVLGFGMDGLQNCCEFFASHGDLCS